MRPVDTQHQLAKERLIKHVGHVRVGKLVCAFAVKGFPVR